MDKLFLDRKNYDFIQDVMKANKIEEYGDQLVAVLYQIYYEKNFPKDVHSFFKDKLKNISMVGQGNFVVQPRLVSTGDLVIRRLPNSCDVRFVESFETGTEEEGGGVLLVNGVADLFYHPDNIDVFHKEFRILCHGYNLFEEDKIKQ